MTTDPHPSPIWRTLESATACPVAIDPQEIAALLEVLADLVEQRGDRGLDLDPGETADWLRSEAARAQAGE
jgi:hypothetical protein